MDRRDATGRRRKRMPGALEGLDDEDFADVRRRRCGHHAGWFRAGFNAQGHEGWGLPRRGAHRGLRRRAAPQVRRWWRGLSGAGAGPLGPSGRRRRAAPCPAAEIASPGHKARPSKTLSHRPTRVPPAPRLTQDQDEGDEEGPPRVALEEFRWGEGSGKPWRAPQGAPRPLGPDTSKRLVAAGAAYFAARQSGRCSRARSLQHSSVPPPGTRLQRPRDRLGRQRACGARGAAPLPPLPADFY
jgi:hypothetical protein